MIAIFNISRKGTKNATYQLQINDKVICRYKHNRHKGLAECLREAAKAVDNDQMKLVERIVENPGIVK